MIQVANIAIRIQQNGYWKPATSENNNIEDQYEIIMLIYMYINLYVKKEQKRLQAHKHIYTVSHPQIPSDLLFIIENS